MLSSKDQQDAERIAAWNQTHAGTLGRVTQATNALIRAINRCEANPGPAATVGLRASGQHLAEVAELELHTPGTGVPEYDGPRRDAVGLWKRAGELVGTWDPADGTTDHRALEAAALLTEGKERNAETNAFAQALLARVRAHFG